MKKTDEFLYDVRIAQRNIRDGMITKKDHDKYLKNLPDSEEKGEALVLEEEQSPQEQAEETQEEESDEESEDDES